MAAGLVASALGLAFEGRVLFEGLVVRVREGETVAVRGPSGSGKTSLLRILAGLQPIQQGEVTLDGQTPGALGWPTWRRKVRYHAQKVPNFGGTPRDLLTEVGSLRSWIGAGLGPDDPVARAQRWLLPAEAWDRPWNRLSVGEQQRILLALSMTAEPRVLLLDEPTAALDGDVAAAVERDLKGRAALWITHDDGQAERVADRVLHVGRR